MTIINVIFRLFALVFVLQLIGCTENSKPAHPASKVIPFFQHWNLILGDGSNAGKAIDYDKIKQKTKHSLQIISSLRN